MSPLGVFSAPEKRPTSRKIAALGSAVLAAAGLTALTVIAAPGSPATATPNAAVAGRGATVPFIEQEAENAATNGTVIGPDRTAGTLAGEASGRKAVTLTGQGKYVEFTLSAPSNSLDFRYSLPTAPRAPGSTARSRSTSTAPTTAT